MNERTVLVVASLLAIVLMTFHFTQDTLHARAGTPEAGGVTLVTVPILAVWLYGTLILAERRSGLIIMLIGSLLALAMPVFHVMPPAGIFHGEIAKGERFMFVWTLHALGLIGLFSLMLSVRCLWKLRRGQAAQ